MAKQKVLTPETLPEAKKSVNLFTSFVDIFRPEEEFKIEWTSPDYKRISALWGLFEYERGERMTFVIRGKAGFCAAVLKELRKNGGIKLLEGKPLSRTTRKTFAHNDVVS